MKTSDGRQSATIDPAARKDGHVPGFDQYELDDQMYVIPDDVAGFVPGRLDRNLFNVSLLADAAVNTAKGGATEEATQVIVQRDPTKRKRRT
ncbi:MULTISPECIES: hypothetical protein [Streptosporangium]|uniref:Uncharacterized protein n=1 Tax=Streptosporangium brasiliense TaxID=47480 RepID=A0ABT9RH96_9ACTN|nr:hypothetical protein [Streptosporangium brasiliense]MDP9868605.1 hypothetical protein [Streptosporangium brasiliense]